MKKLRLAWFTEANSRRWDEGAQGFGFGYDFRNIDYYLDMGRMLDRGLFDMLILADSAEIYEVNGSPDLSVRLGETIGFLSPSLLMAAIATVTKTLGLVPTISTLAYYPYQLARELATLDTLSRGRSGWNIVTALDHRMAQNFGHEQLIPREQRYEQAGEFLDVCKKLWHSWDADKIVMDRERHVFAEPGAATEISFAGKWFKSRGPLNTLPGPQTEPVYLQAGGSPAGMDFAAKNADAVISHGNSIEAMKEYCSGIKERAKRFGRDPDKVKVFFTFRPFIGDDAEDAHGKRNRLLKHIENSKPDVGLLKASIKSGMDLTKLPLDEPLKLEQFTNKETGVVGMYKQHYGKGETPTLRQVMAREGMMESLPLVGSAAQVADRLAEIQELTGMDGIAIREGLTHSRVSDIIDRLVPELQSRNMLRTGFRHPTFRENLLDEEA